MNADNRKSMKIMKYLVLKSYNDYDCGAPCANIVNNAAYNTWQEAYDAIVNDILKSYEVSSLDELECDYELPDRDNAGSYAHKCGSAWINDDDGQVIYDIQMIKVG